jgi:hypothetical protein
MHRRNIEPPQIGPSAIASTIPPANKAIVRDPQLAPEFLKAKGEVAIRRIPK